MVTNKQRQNLQDRIDQAGKRDARGRFIQQSGIPGVDDTPRKQQTSSGPERDSKGRFVKEKEYVFSRIAKNVPIGYTGSLEKEARDWFRDAAMGISKVNVNRVFESQKEHMISRQAVASAPKNRNSKASFIGRMLCYNYDPKWKKILPYYDKFPVIFVVEMYKDGFLGINLHYLPPLARAKLMDALYGTMNTQMINEKSRLRISYSILNSAVQFKAFKPCVKRYLYSHVRSQFMFVEPAKWDIVLFLPIAKFVKSTQEQVWRDSMQKLHG